MTMVDDNSGQAASELCRQDRCAGIVTLKRPGRRNAVTPEHCRTIGRSLQNWARQPQIYAAIFSSAVPGVFSAGADLHEAIDVLRRDPAEARRNLASEYRCVWNFDCFPKPSVALIDGIVMGSGIGISHFGTHRVAGEAYTFTVPECGLGLVPDVGQAFILGRLAGETGAYLALTGHRLGAADAYRLGLVTHVIGRAEHAAIIAGLADADPIDPLLDSRHAVSGAGDLASHAGLIADCFAAGTASEILLRLQSVQGAGREFAEAAAASMLRGRPLAQEAALRQIRRAGRLDVRDTLRDDYRIATRLMTMPGKIAGLTAFRHDKTTAANPWGGEPRVVDPASVDALFAPLGDDDLQLPERHQMRATTLDL